mmetsp:Transcript_77617/g.241827  ORF Transcript_77617/g.241827 Transcript_77617/m.241827 type:complete len:580 (+) Transcript_77617:3-1742(+)
MRRIKAAEQNNICVKLCNAVTLVAPHLLWIGLMACGFGTGRLALILCGLAVLSYHVGAGMMAVAIQTNSMPTADKHCGCLRRMSRTRRWGRLAWDMQAWGEDCCGLEYNVQLQRRLMFSTMVLMQAALFAALGWTGYTSVCAILVSLQLVQLTVKCQVPWGWLFSLVEAGVVFLFTAYLSLKLPRKKQAIETVLFVLAHQCGLARKTYYGLHGHKVVKIVTAILFGALVLVVAATTLSVTRATAAEDDYTMLCDNCTYYRVPYVKQRDATGLACPAWFHLGTRHRKISLSDFGLFSAIAYESESTIRNATELFYPGWQLVYSKRMNAHSKSHDWTTFFEFRSPGNETSIFVVRGTSTALDALNDMIIWMPAAVMQAFNMLGPDMLAPVARAISWLSEIFGKLDNANYVDLLTHVITTMQKEPEREYYITGHSLGGGLAKIVALKALVKGLELPAVTFMSPGLMSTQYLVEGQDLYGKIDGQKSDAYLRDNMLAVTVMPENDIVSRIDSQTGQVVPIGCPAGNPLRCHLMGTGLCEIFETCGSARYHKDIWLPCGICSKAPCIDGVYKKDFKVVRNKRTK